MFGWFKKKDTQPTEVFDYSFLAVDMHSHVLPGIDDGAQTLEDSVLLIKEMMSMGIRKIIATPHIMVDYYRNTPETINTALNMLTEHLQALGIDIPIQAAAEHYFDEYFLQLIDRKQLMLMNGNRILFELPFTSKPNNLNYTVQKMLGSGLQPILAHPERYPYLSLEEVEQLRNFGCRMQTNTIAFTGYYGKSVKTDAETLADAGMIDYLSSDMHHPRHAAALRDALQLPYVKKLKDEGQLLNHELL
jgi:protein-tyrosine phosphatase